MTLDDKVLTMLKMVKRVVTQDQIDFELFMSNLKDKILSDPEKWEACSKIDAFYTVSNDDFKMMSQLYDSSIEYPQSSDHNNLGFTIRELIKTSSLANKMKICAFVLDKFFDGTTQEQLFEQMKAYMIEEAESQPEKDKILEAVQQFSLPSVQAEEEQAVESTL